MAFSSKDLKKTAFLSAKKREPGGPALKSPLKRLIEIEAVRQGVREHMRLSINYFTIR